MPMVALRTLLEEKDIHVALSVEASGTFVRRVLLPSGMARFFGRVQPTILDRVHYLTPQQRGCNFFKVYLFYHLDNICIIFYHLDFIWIIFF